VPARPNAAERASKLKKRLEVMPTVYEKVGIPEISEKMERVIGATEVLSQKGIYSLLDERGVIGHLRVTYLNFARIVYSLMQRYTSNALAVAVNNAKQAYLIQYSWLDPRILDEIISRMLAPSQPTAQLQAQAPRGT
jgi:hypothetical protein